MSRTSHRLAGVNEYCAFSGETAPAEWPGIKPFVLLAERDGEPVAIGAVSWDQYGRAWGEFGCKEKVSAALMHRTALHVLRMLREVGEPVIYAFCDKQIEGAEKWLRRLGFQIDDGMTTDPERPVWRRDLTD